ncbi:hypothetical protein J7E95_27675 [Streptomyces sp. ISL-14]|nr:hypothetical protein [Streptomyces sp. ISL-14]
MVTTAAEMAALMAAARTAVRGMRIESSPFMVGRTSLIGMRMRSVADPFDHRVIK